MTDKEKIIKIFMENVQGKKSNTVNKNQKHDGKEGHWLEKQFGITANADNKADIFGYELKNETTSKTTFGDWSANVYIYRSDKYNELFIGNRKQKQNNFLHIFGRPNRDKDNRYSWLGKPCPKIKEFNEYGQILVIEPNEDIVALYNFDKDMRCDKNNIIPTILKQKDLELARWFGKVSPTPRRADKCLKEKLEDKFNNKGWITCKKDINGNYKEICFGDPINYSNWLKLVSLGIIFFDSGMYEGNERPYSQWRASNKLWDSLIIERYS